ncbi:MAG TPA: hypothetical protein VK988_12770 [Acidimicrobiales bacterium]|nr:hypothetical protein [Acidimicrobiales bacterium]
MGGLPPSADALGLLRWSPSAVAPLRGEIGPRAAALTSGEGEAM